MRNNFFKYSEYTNKKLPNFGYKIHISSTIENYKEILNLAIPFLDKKRVSYKYIYREENIVYNYSVKEDAAESGKLITIYPENTAKFKELIEELYNFLPKDLDGIYILSDRNYKDSNIIFYRYGTIIFDLKKTYKGLPTIYGPDGEIWQDYQKTYFDLPNWIDDIQSEEEYLDSYLSQNYTVTDVLKYSNGGNVYKAITKENKAVAIKESRPYIISFDKFMHRDERENEYILTQYLDKHVAQAIEKVDEWINKYYVYELIDGSDFYTQLINMGVFGFTMDHLEENIKLLKDYLNIVMKTANLIKYFHDNDIVLNDIHTDNFVLNEEKLYFIDLGNSYIYGNKPRYGILSDIALKEWNSLDGKLSDLKKMGNMMLFTLAKLHIKEEYELIDNLSILDKLFNIYGINTNLTEFIYRIMTEKFTIQEFIQLLNEVNISECKNEIRLKINNPSNIETDFKFSDFIHDSRFIEILHQYEFDDYHKTKYMIEKEKRFGIFGLSGILLKLINEGKKEKYRKLIEYGIQSIINNLLVYEEYSIVPIKNNNGSPYIDTGSSGFIKLLLNFDSKKI